MDELLSNLNEEQRQAVLATDGPLLILAGAGSGKTRVITYRIAHLISEKGVPPWNILAVTFTNKAAQEMRERVQRLLRNQELSSAPWVSTFHSLCVRILRQDIEQLREGYSRSFTIYDQDDSLRLIKNIIKDVGYDDRSEEHTSELQSHLNLVCRLLLEKKKKSHCLVTVLIRKQQQNSR